MEVFLLILFGFISGILGGMGMGGGTLLIPLVSFLDFSQHSIQAMNLISFLPMAFVALAIHFKHKLVRPKQTLFIILPAVIMGMVGAFVTKFISQEVLRICFGVLLVILGVWQFVLSLIALIRKDKGNDRFSG